MKRTTPRRHSIRRTAAAAIAALFCAGVAAAPSAAMDFDTDNIDLTGVRVQCQLRANEHGISVGPCAAPVYRLAKVKCTVSYWFDYTVTGNPVTDSDGVSSASCGRRTLNDSWVEVSENQWGIVLERIQ